MGSIYFVECGDAIKIGFSVNVEKRMRHLATGASSPLSLIATIPGTRKIEAAIHKFLSLHRRSGEWFVDCDGVRDTINRLIADGPDWMLAKMMPGTHPEFAIALRKLAEPLSCDDTIKVAIHRAADKVGLSYWRTFDIWYGKARRVEISEALLIARALMARQAVRELGGKDRT